MLDEVMGGALGVVTFLFLSGTYCGRDNHNKHSIQWSIGMKLILGGSAAPC